MAGYILLYIEGMTSAKCEETITDVILRCNGVEDAKASFKERELVIKVNIFGIDINELKNVVEGVGFSVNAMYFNTQL